MLWGWFFFLDHTKFFWRRGASTNYDHNYMKWHKHPPPLLRPCRDWSVWRHPERSQSTRAPLLSAGLPAPPSWGPGRLVQLAPSSVTLSGHHHCHCHWWWTCKHACMFFSAWKISISGCGRSPVRPSWSRRGVSAITFTVVCQSYRSCSWHCRKHPGLTGWTLSYPLFILSFANPPLYNTITCELII